MARIKVRFELNKGRIGAPLGKLGDISRQAEKFLRSLANDVKIGVKAEEWLAVNFRNGSVSYDAEFQGEITPAEVDAFNLNLEFLADYDPGSEGANGLVSQTTALEFAKLGTLIDPDEVIGLGIYSRERSKPIWRRISYSRTAEIRARLEAPIPAYGSVQGIIHSLQKEVSRPYFSLRELSTSALVRCSYPMRLYGKVIEALRERTTVLHVAGDTTYDRATRSIVELRVDRIEKARMLSGEEFEQLFGSAPDFTGDLSTDEYIDAIREDGGH
jgi:hypothetical protein